MGFFSKGILGINARNLLYIKPFNKRKDILFADDKLKTKHYLAARGVNVPKLYGVIRNKEELDKFDFNNLPNNFVLKPNLGSGGAGIIPIVEHSNNTYITSSGKILSQEVIKEHIIDIIDGRFAVNNNPDSAFFEQLLITHESVAPYTYKGLPDLRIVVFNLIPVMAMLRLPTRESDGRANLQQGAVGVGLDLAKGETTYITQNYKIIPEIPDVGPIKIKIPFWDQILEMSVKTQLISNLGYLAVDIALDQTSGPVLLEINARAGLKVQIANLAGLKKRLERIKGIKVTTPEKGIRIAKDMFGNVTEKAISNVSGKTIISDQENIEILNEKHNIVATAKINLNQEKTTINEALQKQIKNFAPGKKIKIILGKERITTLATVKENQIENIIIGRRDLGNFLIDPTKRKDKIAPLPKPESKKEPIPYFIPKTNYGEVDHQLYELDRKVRLVSHLAPTNLKEELEKFSKDKTYNPQFIYKEPKIDILKIKQEIADIQVSDSALGQVFGNKKEELLNRFKLIEARGTDQFTAISHLNFAKPSPELVQRGFQMLEESYKHHDIHPATITAKKAKEIFEETLASYGLTQWNIKFKPNMHGNCSVSKGNAIFIRTGAKFSEQKLKKLIAHEIETHILTNENGRKQPYRIFQVGTANYLKTQEGLAVYNQENAVNAKYNFWGVGTFLATYLAEHHSFSETYERLIKLGIGKKRALTMTAKTKRGIEDTSQPGAFTKGYMYFMGAVQIEEFVLAGGNLADLYVGKIDIESIDLINTISNLNKPYYLPHWYKDFKGNEQTQSQ
ncbi:hypothetical protein COV81_05070 [Candidatus Peregrinibacteria bacterium CG11_big_fil_rev_8_21_14_0_20_41_10]|nr:MAG: hypothetical protein COV81_05070 [Candidatus Peregrinibacteria bacterium CG11_big_fil_rev_8_21_14_0_20_41_10]PIZ76199.1 MAG: hypothetical protein COY06_02235 [Candidatus Peregrinibacteria bacterium CG_4_10_14_0_2_um_filter_41_8]PJC37700.1 MAG: hypothetical protein CO045_04385 [Candidatus Peregrinibacteria bacterium CG_4_9_14_0_2_um_filter_41_14]